MQKLPCFDVGNLGLSRLCETSFILCLRLDTHQEQDPDQDPDQDSDQDQDPDQDSDQDPDQDLDQDPDQDQVPLDPPDCSPGSGGAPAGPPPGAPAVDLPSPERTFQKDVPNAAFKERRVPSLRIRPGRPSAAARSSDASFPVPTATSLCSFTTNNHLDSTTLVCCLCAFGLAPSAAPHHL
ncbi:unnamed protein product [Boreogadus saida]